MSLSLRRQNVNSEFEKNNEVVILPAGADRGAKDWEVLHGPGGYQDAVSGKRDAHEVNGFANVTFTVLVTTNVAGLPHCAEQLAPGPSA